MKKVYKIINEATNGKSVINEKIYINDDNNKKFNNETDLANFYNEYFINIGINIKNKIENIVSPDKIKIHLKSSIFLQPVNDNEIINTIDLLRNDVTTGKDGITV